MMFDESREQFRKGYSSGKDAYQRASSITVVVTTLLGAGLFEILAHYTTWSFVPRIAVAVAAIVVAQYLAGRFFNRLRPKAGG
jgi:uncharacterized PurR-regulated membrane protein YhhQ (DUF165 family)